MNWKKLHYYRNKFGMRKPFSLPAEDFAVTTDDGVSIQGSVLEGTGSLAFLVVHGLAANRLAPGFREFAESLTRFGSVWSIDLRGHGRSGGQCTLGNKEAVDVATAMKYIREHTELPLVLVGFSMGAAAVVRAAGLFERADAVAAVSGPAHWGGWRGPGAHRTSLIWRSPGGRLLMRALTGVRIKGAILNVPSPSAAAPEISPTPLLVVHGDADAFFPPEEAKDLFAAATDPKELWLIEDGGHAEGLFMVPGEEVERDRADGFADELVRRIQSLMSNRPAAAQG